jgi:hypothetical protein
LPAAEPCPSCGQIGIVVHRRQSSDDSISAGSTHTGAQRLRKLLAVVDIYIVVMCKLVALISCKSNATNPSRHTNTCPLDKEGAAPHIVQCSIATMPSPVVLGLAFVLLVKHQHQPLTILSISIVSHGIGDAFGSHACNARTSYVCGGFTTYCAMQHGRICPHL